MIDELVPEEPKQKASLRQPLQFPAAVLLAALLAWGRYYPDLLGLAVLAVVIICARNDKADQMRAATEKPAAEPAPLADPAAEPATEPTPEPTAKVESGREPAVEPAAEPPARTPRSQRSLMLLAMAAMSALGIIATEAFLLTSYEPACRASYFSVFLNGARQGVDRGRCSFLARDLVAGTALIVPVAVVLIGLALADYRSNKKRVWYKLPWFALVAFIGSPPMPWNYNAVFMAFMVCVGAGLLLLIDSRMKPGGKRGAHVELPYRKIAAGALALVLLGGTVLVFQRNRAGSRCRTAAAQTFDTKIEPQERVERTLPESDLESILKAAKEEFEQQNTSVDIQKAALWGDAGLGLFKWDTPAGPQLAVGTMARDSSGWRVRGVTNGYDTYQPLPGDAGAAVFFGTPETMPPFVEPGITRVESVDRCGTVIDRDEPAGGFFMVLVTKPGNVRAFRGSTLAAAFPSVNLSPQGKLSPLDDESRKVAESFAHALVEKGGDAAARYTDFPEAADVIRSFAPAMTGRYDVDGPVRETDFNGVRLYVVPLSFPGGRGVLAIQTADEGDGWKVTTLHMTASLQPRAPNIDPDRPEIIA